MVVVAAGKDLQRGKCQVSSPGENQSTRRKSIARAFLHLII
jgi:hypothetical protein